MSYLRIGIAVAILALLAGMSWRLQVQAKDLRAARIAVAAEKTRADNNADALKLFAGALANNEKIAKEVAAQRRELRASVQSIQQEISSAPPEDDAPISPVMLRTLERLRDIAKARSADAVPEGGDPVGAH